MRVLASEACRAWLLALALAGCQARTPLPHPPEPDPMDLDEYVIGTADVLQINVWKNPELSLTVPVRPDGKISVPLLDDVQAAGLTPIELKEVLARSLQEYVAAPDVTVVVSQVNSKRIFLIGNVGRPGALPLNQELRILDAIALAGGFREFADTGNVRILRRNGSGVDEYRFDYDAFLAGETPDANLLLHPHDTIVVP
jgi:polysaccharide export outer membrane protein